MEYGGRRWRDAWVGAVLLLAGCRARGAADAQCAYNSDCADGLACVASFCRAQCVLDRDCAAGFRCAPGADPLHPVCVRPADSLRPLCRVASDCTPGWTCATEGFCTLPCGGASGCSALPPGWTCDATMNRCVPPPLSTPDAQVTTDASTDGAPAVGPVELAAGGEVTCARMPDGTVRCWGANRAVQLGDDTGRDALLPVPAPGVAGAVELAGSVIGGGPVCVRTGDGRVLCPSASGFAALAGLNGGVELANATIGALLRRADGTVLAAGDNYRGLLGVGDSNPRTGAVQVQGLTDATQLTGGAGFACALRRGGTVVCWGENRDGCLGLGAGAPAAVSSPQPVPSLDRVVEVRAGYNHACARRDDGTVWCWGGNSFGSAVPEVTVNVPAPRQVMGLANAVELRLGTYFSCARLGDGTARCWGNNEVGQRGDDGATGSGPTAVSGLTDAVQLAAGEAHACARRATGAVVCWGEGRRGQLGIGRSTVYTRALRPLPDYAAVTALAGGGDLGPSSAFLCAVVAGGAVRCHGENRNGQLGNGGTTSSNTPSAVTGLTSALDLAAGTYHACAWLSDHTARCWGKCDLGQCGENIPADVRDRTRPVNVAGLSTVSALASGNEFVCAQLMDGTVSCWGANDQGAMGRGTTGPSQPAPTAVPGLTNVAQLVATATSVCARRMDGTVSCWGDNGEGQCGNGASAAVQSSPVPVTLVAPAVELAAGLRHVCARHADGRISCWGRNSYGSLGDPAAPNPSRTPVLALRPPAGPTALLAGTDFTCVRGGDARVRCWGANDDGELGDGTGLSSVDPVTTPDPTGATLWFAPNNTTYRCLVVQGAVQCTGLGPGLPSGDRGTSGFFTPQPVML